MPTYQRSTVHSAEDIRAIADHAGSHFFDAATMRFFNSRVLLGVVALDGHNAVEGARFLFVTSERYSDSVVRHYTLRMATLGSVRDNRPAIDIETLSRYRNANEAKAAAQTYAYLEK